MGRRTAVYQTSGGSSGGGVPVFGNVEWGPKFGGLDGDEHVCGVNLDLATVNLAHTKTCGCNIDLFSIDPTYSKTVGVNVDLADIGPTWLIDAVGVNVDIATVDLAHDKSVGCNASLSSVDLAHTKTAGVHMSGTVLGAPFWQSVSTAALSASSASIAVNYPASIEVGDLLLAFIAVTDTGTPGITFITPTGWTHVQSTRLNGSTNTTGGACFYRVADGTEGVSQTFTSTGTVTARRITGEIHRIIGVDSVTPINVSAIATATVVDPIVPSVTTTVDNCLVFDFGAHDHLALSQTHTPPASHAERTDFQSTVATNIVNGNTNTRVFSATGATGTATHNCTEIVATDSVNIRVAVAPGTLTIAS